jgi:hypothetical protein
MEKKEESIGSSIPYSCVDKEGSDSITLSPATGAICRPSLLGRCFLGPKRWMFHAQDQTIQRIPLSSMATGKQLLGRSHGRPTPVHIIAPMPDDQLLLYSPPAEIETGPGSMLFTVWQRFSTV